MDVRRGIRWGVFVVAGLLVLAAAVWTWSRLRPLPASQRDALALLQPSPVPAGRNAFDALWLLGRDVPPARMRAVVDAELARVRAGLADAGGAAAPGPQWAAVEGGLQPGGADRARFCGIRDNCLQRVRADPGGYAALVQRHRGLLQRIAALSGYEFYRNRLPADVRAPMPPFALVPLGVTDAAQAYASGDIDRGLSGACEGITTWRRLGADADSLVVRMLGAELASDGYGRLLARMLSELPADHALPSACDAALAPVALAELSICEAMRGEYAAVAAASELPVGPETGGALRSWLVYDPQRTRALMAGDRGLGCTDASRALLAADRPPPPPRPTPWRMACVANLAGCALADIAAPAYLEYAMRTQDAGARLGLLRGVASLRGVATAPAREAALRRFWAGTRHRGRELRFVDGGRAVEMREFHAARGGWWRVPLPAPD